MEMVQRSVSFYKKMFAHTCKLKWPVVRTIAEDWKREMKRKWPQYYSEIQGELVDLTRICRD